ncbi:DUF2490 domain-containing protein [Flavobacterium sp. MFBS3-15]|uniref:DUF2490 domain-containing protein n=1 Tax=Flavobacterium sp. MFBS3-15 TaxID=2989816 RepID=UPI0022368DDA|nr:DUF2490 domain-containing protein [Flavobacterium sp. MFBS3-15]MCW4467573.1 DUF2490 domain-containing protein [Flavobacterium sp. MFBS3-15]
MKIRFAILACLGVAATAWAQLSPPGMGATKTAYWSAIGINQKLGENNSTTAYLGWGRVSGADGGSPVDMPLIFVANQEFYHKFSPRWKYSVALSYRRQHEYEAGEGLADTDAIQQEFRVYGRLQYSQDIGGVKWATTLRQEVRRFYADDFSDAEYGLQLRTRFKTQVSVPLNSHNSIMGSAEALFSASRDNHAGWQGMGYKESRFCLYYSLSPESLPVTFDVGYMNDLMGHGSHTADASYVAIDIIVKDPF